MHYKKTTNRQTHTISKLLSFSVCKGPAKGCTAQVLQNNVIVNLRQQLTLQYDGHKHFRGNFGDELRFGRGVATVPVRDLLFSEWWGKLKVKLCSIFLQTNGRRTTRRLWKSSMTRQQPLQLRLRQFLLHYGIASETPQGYYGKIFQFCQYKIERTEHKRKVSSGNDDDGDDYSSCLNPRTLSETSILWSEKSTPVWLGCCATNTAHYYRTAAVAAVLTNQQSSYWVRTFWLDMTTQ